MIAHEQRTDLHLFYDFSNLFAPLDVSDTSSPAMNQQQQHQRQQQSHDPALLLAQRVLSLTAYRAELKLMQILPKVKSSSATPALIPVPLAPGETSAFARERMRVNEQA